MIRISAPIEHRRAPGTFSISVRVSNEDEASLVAGWHESNGVTGKWQRPPEVFRKESRSMINRHKWIIYYTELTNVQITHLALVFKNYAPKA